MKDLGKADAAFGHTSGQQTVVSKRAWLAAVWAIHVVNIVGFALEIGQLGNRCLHAIRHFILRNAVLNLWVTNFGMLSFIECVDSIDQLPSQLAADAFRVTEIENGIASSA